MFTPTLLESNPSLIKEILLPNVHQKIDVNHLYDNGKLLTDEEIKSTVEWFEKNQDQNRFKIHSQNGEHYTVVKLYNSNTKADSYQIVYYGEKKQKHLGKGSSFKGKLMQEVMKGKVDVLKIQKDVYSNDEIVLQQEINTLIDLNQFVGDATRIDKKHRLIGTRLAPGITLLEFIQQNPVLTEKQILQIAINIATAVINLHEKDSKLHCDIKLDNIMIDPITFDITLIDYQYALPISKPFHQKSVGADGYKALELRGEKAPYGHSKLTDTVAVGLTIGFLINAVYFFSPRLRHEYHLRRFQIYECDHEYLVKNCRLTSKPIRDKMISSLIKSTHDKVSERLSLPELLQNLNKIYSELDNTPADIKRIGIVDIDECYKNNGTDIDIEPIRQSLANLDDIWFVDTNLKKEVEYIRLRRAFEKHIKFCGKLFYHSIPNRSVLEILYQIPQYIKMQSPAFQYQYFFISAKPLHSNLKESLEAQGINTNPIVLANQSGCQLSLA